MAFIKNGDKIEFEVVVTDHVTSTPPAGKCKVKNFWVNPEDKKVTYDWDDIPEE